MNVAGSWSSLRLHSTHLGLGEVGVRVRHLMLRETHPRADRPVASAVRHRDHLPGDTSGVMQTTEAAAVIPALADQEPGVEVHEVGSRRISATCV